MCAEELTNQVLFMRNIPAGDKYMWMTFEAVEDGQLGETVNLSVSVPHGGTGLLIVCVVVSERPLHPKEKVLEQVLQWCNMADPSSAYLVVKRVPKGEGINILTCRSKTARQTTFHLESTFTKQQSCLSVCLSAYKSDVMKVGLLKCREEPPKLLQGNKFQERTFQIKESKLLLLKDKKVSDQTHLRFHGN